MSDVNRELNLNEEVASILLGNVKVASALSNGGEQLNLLLLGKTGHGKSATGNSTLDRREFKSSSSVSSVTSEVKCSLGECQGFVINVIDTPGMADTTFGNCKVEAMSKMIENMTEALQMSPGGVHAFLFVVRYGNRFTEEEKNCLDDFRHIFGPTFLEENGIVVVTHGDLFQQSMEEEGTPDRSFGEWCREQRGALGDLMKECGYRCSLFNNVQSDRAAKQQQLERLVEQVRVFERSYTFQHFQMHCDLRKKLIIKLKVPKLKEQFQRDINDLNSRSYSGDGLTAIFLCEELDQLASRIKHEDGGTGLLNDMVMQLSTVEQRIHTNLRIQSMRQHEEDDDSCSIL